MNREALAGAELWRGSQAFDLISGGNMVELPSGTVTFLFTDIEGSTQRWQQQPAAMGSALARHDRLVREAMETHGGIVFKTVGDAFCAAFADPAAALDAALTAQRSLYGEPWGA